jgi:pyrophosphatase PpaX
VRFPTVLFDLDGTLIDSGPIILASMRHATQTVLGREIPDDELMALCGSLTLRAQMERFDGERADELVEIYRTHNESIHESLEAFEMTERVLERLRGEGRRLGVVTAKRHASVALAFARCTIERYFDVVVASEDSTRHKPHPEPLLFALERLGTAPDEAAYVGDSPFDIQAAKAAGVYAVAIGWGGIHSRERLEAEEPDAFAADEEELLAVL